jgi:hypothetical protein
MYHPTTAAEDAAAARVPAVSPLIQATAPDGARFVFAILSDQRQCCVMRNGDTVVTAAADEPGIDAAVELLMHACGPALIRCEERRN